MQYMIIEKSSKYDLQDEVQLYIKHGWVPQGGVTVSIGGVTSFHEAWAQAMVKNNA